MKVLVTGATCPLGAAICRQLVERGDEVVGTGRRVTSFPVLAAPHFRAVVADLHDEAAMRAAAQGCVAVIHVAALSSPWGAAAAFERANVTATAQLIAIARNVGIRRFVLVSSASVLFDGRDARDLTEEAPYPRHYLCAYSRSKRDAELLLRNDIGLDTAIIRPRAIYGPGDAVLLPRLVARARLGRLRRIGRRDVLQDLTYVDNAAHACVLALAAPSGRIFHVSDGRPVWLWATIGMVLERLGLSLAGSPLPRRLVRGLATALEFLHHVRPSLGEPTLTRYTAALLSCDQTLSIAAIRRDLGYTPLVDPDLGMARAIADLQGLR